MAVPTVERFDQPCFVLIAYDIDDKDEAARLRETHLDGHLAYTEAHWQKYLSAGPVREPGSPRLTASLFLVFADTQAEARAIISGDPYYQNGLYKDVTCLEHTPAIGRALGGKIWKSADQLRGRAAG